MSSPIDKILLRNFKGFYEENIIDVEGKHLLLYGENGSGKSSIYWSLYTILQASVKESAEIEKYFTPNNDEHLINHHFLKKHSSFAIDGSGKVIQPQSIGKNAFVELKLKNKSSIRIDGAAGLTVNNSPEGDVLENLNRYSDFIAHRLLINFYNFQNSRTINLWEVFVRDIFPFLLTDLGNGNVSLGNILKEIENNKPFYAFTGNTFKVKTRRSKERKDYESKIRKFNENIEEWISEINRLVNDFYNNHFREKEDIELKIALDYDVKLSFGDIFQTHNYNRRDYKMESKRFVDLNKPFINLKVWHRDKNNWIVIDRPQTFFNEAKLTQIALSIRFSLLDDSIRPPYPGQFLALDDLLISLDMSNRDKVLDIILNEFANKYKVYILTHEKGFFNMAKNRIESEYNRKEWQFKEMFGTEKNDEKPILKESSTFLAKSINLYRQKDYPAAVNYLRKELENILDQNLPGKIKKGNNGEDLNTLDSLLNSGIYFLERLEIKPLPLKRCQQYVRLLMNPLSHNAQDIDAYEVDIRRIQKILEELRPFMEHTKDSTREILPRLKKVDLDITERDGITKQKFTFELLEDLYCIKDGAYFKLANCKVQSLESKTYIRGMLQVKESYRNNHYKEDSLEEVYKVICKRKNLHPQNDVLNLFKTKKGKKLFLLM